MGKGRLGLGRVAPAPASVCYALPCAGGDGELGGKGAQLNLLFKSFGAGNRTPRSGKTTASRGGR